MDERFGTWLAEQAQAGREFTPQQLEWLTRIKDHIATSLRIEMDDFEYTPFHEMGGLIRLDDLFGADLGGVLEELNEVLVA